MLIAPPEERKPPDHNDPAGKDVLCVQPYRFMPRMEEAIQPVQRLPSLSV